MKVLPYAKLVNEGTIFDIVFRSGFEKSLLHSEMVEAVEAHNELLCSEDPIIVSQVQTALQEYGEPAYRADRGFRLVGEPVTKGTNTIDSTRGVKITGAKESVETSLDEGQLGAKETADSGLEVREGTVPVEEGHSEVTLRGEDTTSGIDSAGNVEGATATSGQTDADVTPSERTYMFVVVNERLQFLNSTCNLCAYS